MDPDARAARRALKKPNMSRMNQPSSFSPGPLPPDAMAGHRFAPPGGKPFSPPPLPPGFRPPPGVKIENGRPRPKWGDLADAPFHAIAGDKVSSLLQRVRVSTIPFQISEMSGRWGLGLPPVPCGYIAVATGRMFLRSDHLGPFELSAGQAAIVFQPTGISISDSRETPIGDVRAAMGPDHFSRHSGLKMGDGAPTTRFMGGPLLFDSGVGGPLRSALPEVVPLSPAGPPHDAALVRGVVGMLEGSRLDQRPGSGVMLNQLVTILVIEAMRSYLQLPEAGAAPWAGALFDEHLGPMLSLLHSTPARPWTLQEMANESGLSRTVFAERFLKVVGVPPAAYVRNFRMEMSKDLLRTSDADVRLIARRVGYSSEAAFCNVFKKTVGLTPSEFRERARIPGGSAAGEEGVGSK